MRLKEKGIATEVVAVSCGVAACQETLRTAHGASAPTARSWWKPMSSCSRWPWPSCCRRSSTRRSRDLVILGKQAIDDDANQTGQMLAALLDWPQATFASKVEIADGDGEVKREVDGGLETIEIKLPAVVTTDLRLNEPRYATLPNIMKAKKKPLETVTPEALGVDVTPRLTTLKVVEPAKRKAAARWRTCRSWSRSCATKRRSSLRERT